MKAIYEKRLIGMVSYILILLKLEVLYSSFSELAQPVMKGKDIVDAGVRVRKGMT